MFETGNLGLFRRRLGLAGIVLLGALASALGWATQPAAADPPYEPNGTMLNPAGPLGYGAPIVAGLETQSDRDFFFFYVTSPDGANVTVTLGNLGGGSRGSNLAATILDTSATPVGGVSYVNVGESRVAAVTLEPQKYFVEVAPNEGFGDSYSLTGGGDGGAFGAYAPIARRCAKATRWARVAKRRLRRAGAKLQRTTARLRRSRYNGRRARVQARRAHRKAKSRRNARKRALRKAKRSRSPWCSIPQ